MTTAPTTIFCPDCHKPYEGDQLPYRCPTCARDICTACARVHPGAVRL